MVEDIEIGNKFFDERLIALVGGEEFAQGVVNALPAAESAAPTFYTYDKESSRDTLGAGALVVCMAPLYLVSIHAREDHAQGLKTALFGVSAIKRAVCTTTDATNPGIVTITGSDESQYAVSCHPEPNRGTYRDRGPGPNGALYNRVGGFFRLHIVRSSTA